MAKKADMEQMVRENLLVGHFGDPDEKITSTGDPIAECMVVLNLDQLKEYDRNPRQAPNAEYDTLRKSLFSTGAQKTLLVVTKRPEDSHYFPAAGGNTRLRILKELWEETGDERFYQVTCKFVPYVDDLRILVDHLSENDNRADYIFIDRSKALWDIYETLDDESGGGHRLSDRKFLERLMELGYPKMSRSHFLVFKAAIALYDYIPQALDGGLHSKGVREIQTLSGELKSFLRSACGIGPDIGERFDAIWPGILNELDSPDGVNLSQAARRTFEAMVPAAQDCGHDELSEEEIASRFQKLWPRWKKDPSQYISLRMDTPGSSSYAESKKPGPVRVFSDQSEHENGSDDPGMSEVDIPDSQSDDPGKWTQDIPPHTSTGSSRSTAPSRGQPDTNKQDIPLSDSTSGKLSDDPRFIRLTEDTYQNALHLASTFGMEHLVFEMDRIGLGFWIDLPDRELNAGAAQAWWWLWNVSALERVSFMFAEFVRNREGMSDSRLAERYRDVCEGNASLDKDQLDGLPEKQRNRAIWIAFLHLLESLVPKPRQHESTFFMSMSDQQFAALSSVLHTARSLHQLERRHRERREHS